MKKSIRIPKELYTKEDYQACPYSFLLILLEALISDIICLQNSSLTCLDSFFDVRTIQQIAAKIVH